MIKYDLARARLAVQVLVESPYFQNHVKKLRLTIQRPRSLPFSDDLEPLNELVTIGRQNAQALENLIDIAANKRSDRNDYQREYMAAKRKRDRKVLALEELLTGKVLDQDERMSVLHRQYAVWNKEKDQHLAQFNELPWLARNQIIREFWTRKEAELDALAADARQRGPVKRKRTVMVDAVPETEFGAALDAALRGRSNS